MIVKVVGQTIGYNYLLKRLTEIWKSKAMFELIALDNGFLLAHFNHSEDFNYALLGVPGWLQITILQSVNGAQNFIHRQQPSIILLFGFIFHVFQLSILMRNSYRE